MGIGFPRFSPEGKAWITWWDGRASRMQARSSSPTKRGAVKKRVGRYGQSSLPSRH